MTDHPSGDKEKTIICIEDEPAMIELVKLILTSRGYKVMAATGAASRQCALTVSREEPVSSGQ